jgi:hypothetical protein
VGKKSLYLPEQEETPSTEDRFEMADDMGIAQADNVRPHALPRAKPVHFVYAARSFLFTCRRLTSPCPCA